MWIYKRLSRYVIDVLQMRGKAGEYVCPIPMDLMLNIAPGRYHLPNSRQLFDSKQTTQKISGNIIDLSLLQTVSQKATGT